MTISTFPTTDPDNDGIRWWASADVHSVVGGQTFSVFAGKMFPCSPHNHIAYQKSVIKAWASKEGTLNDCESYVKCSNEAKGFAKSYQELSPKDRLIFIQPCISHIEKISSVLPMAIFAKRLERVPLKNEYVLLEPFIPGKMEYFIPEMSTGGAKLDDFKVLDTFSHFTYWKSQEQLVVCEFQGVISEGTFKLTCPTIHSKEQTFGENDRSHSGIRDFFSRHTCNATCQAWPRFEQDAFEQDRKCETEVKEPSCLEKKTIATEAVPRHSHLIEPSQRGPVFGVLPNSTEVTFNVTSTRFEENIRSIGTTTLPYSDCVLPSAPPMETIHDTLEIVGGQHPIQYPPSYSEVTSHDTGCATNTSGSVLGQCENKQVEEQPPPYTGLTPPPLYTEFAEPLARSAAKKHKYAQTSFDPPSKIQKSSNIVTQKSCSF